MDISIVASPLRRLSPLWRGLSGVIQKASEIRANPLVLALCNDFRERMGGKVGLIGDVGVGAEIAVRMASDA